MFLVRAFPLVLSLLICRRAFAGVSGVLGHFPPLVCELCSSTAVAVRCWSWRLMVFTVITDESICSVGGLDAHYKKSFLLNFSLI